jgi:hypothetical protein
MAIDRKRQAGPCLTWFGFDIYLSMGIITAAPETISHPHYAIQSIVSGAVVTFD